MSDITSSLALKSEFVELPASGKPGCDALRIEYRWLNASREAAPIAVFLHEGLGSIEMWKDWPQTLCDKLGMRGLVYSRPGYGRSTPRAHDVKWSSDFMSDQAEAILPALLDALNIKADERSRIWVIGHSDGGSITLLYAAAFPDALAGVVTIAPHVFVEDISVESIAEAKAAYEHGNLRQRLSRYHDDVDSAFYGWNDIWLDPAFRAWSIVDRLHAIRAPLLAIQGYDDQYGTMAQINTIAEHVTDARIVKLHDCGHSPHRDTPDALNDAISEFINTVDRARSE